MDKVIYRISDIGEVVGGGTPSTKVDDFWGGTIPWISPDDLTGYKNVFIKHGKSFITPLGLRKSSTKMMPEGTILISSRAPIGYVAIAANPLCTNQGFKSLVPNKKINNLYFYYWIKCNLEYIKLFGSGATFPEISGSRMKKIKVEVFRDIDYQTSVATVLNDYDTLIENNSRRIKILDEMAKALFEEWFVRFRFPGHMKAKIENGIPEGWSIKKIKEVVKRLPFGQTYKGSELSESGEVMVIDQSTEEYLGFHDGEASHKASFEEPLLLFGDHTCKYQLMCKDFSLGENIIPYRNVDPSIDRYFLFYATKDIIKTEEYKRHWGRFVNFKILIPPIELQKEYRKIIIRFEKEKNLLWDQNQNLIKQRDSLLPRLISGKLSVEGKEIV